MNINHNKEIVIEFFRRFTANDIAGALDTLSDDVTWWISAKPDALPVAGALSKERLAQLFHRMDGQMKDGLRLTVKGMVAEENKVAVEAESYAELKNSRVYNQNYHFLMEIQDGKIAAVREYLDTQHVHAVWFQP